MSGARTFLVSGCASGIGKHLALSLARAPAEHRIVMLDLDGDGLERTLREHGLHDSPRVLARKHDVRDAEGWETIVRETVERFGALDVMLNVAGFLRAAYVHELSAEDVDRHIDVNTKGVMHATRVGARQMLRQRSGHIVNIASLAGISHVPGLSAYCASKHAVRGFSLAVAHELSPHGIAVTVVCPDAVETPMLEREAARPEAAMVFGGGRGLTLEEVERVLVRILDERPLEVVIPVPGSGRGALAKLANAFPGLTPLALERVLARGRATQIARGSGER